MGRSEVNPGRPARPRAGRKGRRVLDFPDDP